MLPTPLTSYTKYSAFSLHFPVLERNLLVPQRPVLSLGEGPGPFASTLSCCSKLGHIQMKLKDTMHD